jgi:hypothetical protein
MLCRAMATQDHRAAMAWPRLRDAAAWMLLPLASLVVARCWPDAALCGAGPPWAPFVPRPGQSWLGAAASFVAMWTLMMPAMMAPALGPVVRQVGERWPARLALAGGYVLAWGLAGVAVFPIGAALVAWGALSARTATAAALLAALALQVVPWTRRHLAQGLALPGGRTPLVQGLVLGWHGLASHLGPTAAMLVLGIMDWRVMLGGMAAMALTRHMPRG